MSYTNAIELRYPWNIICIIIRKSIKQHLRSIFSVRVTLTVSKRVCGWIDQTFPHNHIHKMQCTHNRSLMQIRRDWEHKRGRARRNNGNQPWTSESISECHSVIGWHSHCITLNSIDNTCRPLPPLAFISLMHRVAHHYKCYNPTRMIDSKRHRSLSMSY